MAKATNKTEASLDKPLFSLSYDLSAQLTDEAARLLAGDKMRNPASVTSYAVLVLIVIAALAPATKGNMPLLVGMVVVEVILWGLADRWPQVQLRKLRHAGLDTALIPADKRRRTVAVYEDTLTVTSPDAAETLRIADLRGATLGNEMAVLAVCERQLRPRALPRDERSALPRPSQARGRRQGDGQEVAARGDADTNKRHEKGSCHRIIAVAAAFFCDAWMHARRRVLPTPARRRGCRESRPR